MYQLVDFLTKDPRIPRGLVFTGNDSPWEIIMDLNKIKKHLDFRNFKKISPAFTKYLPFMPLDNHKQLVSCNELATPLIKSKYFSKKLNIELYFKIEGRNPTGSFKDRGSALECSVAKAYGAKAIILASTGNMAASCAYYAAEAKIPCYVLVPESVSLAKMAQVIAFGGHIIKIKGHYNDAARLAEEIAHKMGFYLAGDYAFRVEGQKTAAFELLDQLSLNVPDFVLVPIGCGTNIAAYAKGFFEYRDLGIIDGVPQLVGVQAEGAAAVVHSYNKNLKNIISLNLAKTIASAIAVPHPLDGIKALNAIYTTNGCAVSVTDEEIMYAQLQLAKVEGIFAESASAATIAALSKLSQKIDINNKKVICILTGDGLKDAHVVFNSFEKLSAINPDVNGFLDYYSQRQNHATV